MTKPATVHDLIDAAMRGARPDSPLYLTVCDEDANLPGCVNFPVEEVELDEGHLRLRCWDNVAHALRREVQGHNENRLTVREIVERIDRVYVTLYSLFDGAEEQHERDVLCDLAEALVGLGATPSVEAPDRYEMETQRACWQRVVEYLDRTGEVVHDQQGRRWSLGRCPSGSVYWYCHHRDVNQSVWATWGWDDSCHVAIQIDEEGETGLTIPVDEMEEPEVVFVGDGVNVQRDDVEAYMAAAEKIIRAACEADLIRDSVS